MHEGDKNRDSDWNLRPDLKLSDFDENSELTQLFAKLGRIKQNFPELTYGDYQELQLTNRQFAFARCLDGKAVVTLVNNDDNPAHMEINLPVFANKAVDLLSLQEESEEEKAEREAKRLEAMEKAFNDMKNGLLDKAGQLVGASGEISAKSQDVKAVVADSSKAADFGENLQPVVTSLKESITNMQRVYDEFVDQCGITPASTVEPGNVSGCDSLTIRDGRLIVDLAPNRGVVAYLTNENNN